MSWVYTFIYNHILLNLVLIFVSCAVSCRSALASKKHVQISFHFGNIYSDQDRLQPATIVYFIILLRHTFGIYFPYVSGKFGLFCQIILNDTEIRQVMNEWLCVNRSLIY